MWYKKLCSLTFEKQLKEIYEYSTKDLNSLIGWHAIKANLWEAVSGDDGPQCYQTSSTVKMKSKYLIKRMTVDKYTVFYQVNHEKKEIYLLYLLYRKN